MGTPGLTRPMSVFEHYVARCSIAHQTAVRAARALAPGEDKTPASREVSALTIALIDRLHRLAAMAEELGPAALFATPSQELSSEALGKLFPDG